MFELIELRQPEDYFIQLNNRHRQGMYFYRFNGYHENLKDFLKKYYELARRNGAVIEGRIPNPDEKNLAYYQEIMGMDFQMSVSFFSASLKKWLPRMNETQRNTISASMYETLDVMRKEGKNDNMLRNAYIKFMCWLYYRFEQMAGRLGENEVPKILYEGSISNYELKLLNILCHAGCDIILLQYAGDAEYQKLDTASVISKEYHAQSLTAFPKDFSIKKLREEIRAEQNRSRLYGGEITVTNCTNAWIDGDGLSDIKKKVMDRGRDTRFYYNSFIAIHGVWDKLLYQNDLYQFQLELKQDNRKLCIVEDGFVLPTPEEIGQIQRANYQNAEQMIVGLSKNFQNITNLELKKLIQKAFVDILSEELQKESNINKMVSRAVYLLCWLKRYQQELFSGWSYPNISVLIYFCGKINDNEALFLKFLSKLPVDVLILNPQKLTLTFGDKALYEIDYSDNLAIAHFPNEAAQLRMGTAAYHAERELDTLMYQDSGMYRNRQYSKAFSVNLQTTYEEIAILWKEDVKYRPNFSTMDEKVNIPVIFSKVSGVPSGQVNAYWQSIEKLITEDTFVIKKAPFIQSTDENPMKQYVTEFYKNGQLKRQNIKNHKAYPYGYLREEVQEHILDKLQLLIEQRLIRGTMENGTEYTIIATILNLKPEIVRLIQSFDFTKDNPKLIYIHTTETLISLEDSILTAFLNLVGFDVVFFVPTGYQNVEKHFAKRVMEEHQIGEYMYDLSVPHFRTTDAKTPWHKKLFKRG